MFDFIEGEEDPLYSNSDIKTFGEILVTFNNSIQNHVTIEKALLEVKRLVLGLNELNERCDFSLIETDQREDICQFIFDTLDENGVEFDGDVTEEWRDW